MGDKIRSGALVACWLIHCLLWVWAVVLILKGADHE